MDCGIISKIILMVNLTICLYCSRMVEDTILISDDSMNFKINKHVFVDIILGWEYE